MQLSFADISWIWYLQHLGVSNVTQASLLQLYTMVSHSLLTSVGLHSGTLLPYTVWPQWLSETVKEESNYSFILQASKASIIWMTVLGLASSLEWALASSDRISNCGFFFRCFLEVENILSSFKWEKNCVFLIYWMECFIDICWL